jgi:transposase
LSSDPELGSPRTLSAATPASFGEQADHRHSTSHDGAEIRTDARGRHRTGGRRCWFATAEKLAGYAGTTPRVHAGGGKTGFGRSRPDVNRYLKWAFIEAANAICLTRPRGAADVQAAQVVGTM